MFRLSLFRGIVSSSKRNLSLQSPSKVAPLVSSVKLTSISNPWVWRKNEEIKHPVVNNKIVDFPSGLKWIPPLIEPSCQKIIEIPGQDNNDVPKYAARLIVIRRNKMKRHKLKKLRKRMRFEYAKRRQKREWTKEKEFQAGLIQQCKEAEAFSADKYVAERIQKLNELTAALAIDDAKLKKPSK